MDTARVTYEKREKENLESILELKKKQAVTKREIQQNTTEEERWKSEFEDFRNHQLYKEFHFILDSIYSNNGNITVEGNFHDSFDFYIPQDILIYAHTNDLVTIDKKAGKIELTKKGKFFAKEFSKK